MLGLEKFRIYLQHGKYYPAVVFLKACPQSQSWQRLTFGFPSKENWIDCRFCSQCVSGGGPLRCFFNTLLDPLCWRGDLEEGWAALWTSENPQRVGTGGGGTSRWAELNVWAEADVGFLPSSLHPTPFPRLFTWCQQYFSIAVQNTWVLRKLQKGASERKNLEHSSTEHLENQEHCLPKRKRKQRLHKGTNARSKGDPCGVAPSVGMLPSLPYLLMVFPLWWTLAFWTLQGRRERQSLVGMWLCAGEGVGWDGFSSWKQ